MRFHSKVTKIEAGIEYSAKHLRIIVRDNGCGISPDIVSSGREGHLGLAGMREHAEKIGAELKIWNREQSGTEVEMIVPCQTAFEKKSAANIFKRLHAFYQRKKPTQKR